MLDTPYIQPFKNITLNMKRETNSGVFVPRKTNNATSMDLSFDMKYSPVFYDGTTDKGWAIATTDTDVVVGTLMESFRFEDVPSQVMVRGIVTMVAHTAIAPGDAVAASKDASDNPGIIKVATTGKYAFGTALTGTSTSITTTKPEYVSVLLGGGKI